MKIFKISKKDNGSVIIIRPLLNAKNLEENIVSYKIRFGINFTINNKMGCYKWSYRYMCFALVNEELKIFNYSEDIHKFINSIGIPNLFMMNSNKAIKITVGLKEGFLNNKYEIIEDDKFRFDNIYEKRHYIKNLLTTTDLELSESLNQEKAKIGHLDVKLPDSKGEFVIKTLQEIYDSE